ATSATGIPEFHKFTTSIAPDFYYVDSSVEALQEMIDTEGADSIAAFISEPVQGSGGVNIPSEGYFEQVKKICEENDILFISDKSEEHTSELQSRFDLVCRLLLE